MERAQQILQTIYGYTAFRRLQSEVIETSLKGYDTVVLMPTGGGKSLCYQIPSIVREGTGIIVSPLIALMQDQVSALKLLGIRAAFLNSSQSTEVQQSVLQQLHTGKLDLLYIAPERLLQAQTLQRLTQCKIALIAIDEAHCVSQWGHDFRQDYLGLNILREQFPGVPRMALTATADPRTRKEIAAQLQLNNPQFFVSSFDRPNIRYTLQPKTDARRQLLRFLSAHRNEAGIIYCMSRKKTESIAEWLCSHAFNALAYHAGLPNEARAQNQERFLREEAIIIVATIAFGMGIDKPDVRFVVHLDLPKSIEAYYQETGRAGRDGEPAEAWMVYGLQDVVRLRQMLDESEAEEQYKRIERHKLDALLGWCEIIECRRRALLAYFGDELKQNCGNCDSCLHPPKSWDATIAAQKLLSCIYRTGQLFGAGHVIDVLLGKSTDKIQQRRHHMLSTYGIGKDYHEQQWRSIIRQLIIQGFLHADVERYGALTMTEKSRPLLRGEMTLFLREDLKPNDAQSNHPKPRRENRSVSDNDKSLWEALRACRKQLADSQGVPPYVIFHDATLMEMMEYRPGNLDQLLYLNGVGQTKLDRYGSAFLEVIGQFSS